jgi:nucleotide-binding universal stress UspA family protein
VAFIAIQLVPINRTNPPVQGDFRGSAEVVSVLRRACYDCHSNETVWPWYLRRVARDAATVIVEADWGTPEGHLFEMASRQKVDLIVVGTHQRHRLGRVLLGSVSRAVLHHANVAVAVVPPTESAVRKQRN